MSEEEGSSSESLTEEKIKYYVLQLPTVLETVLNFLPAKDLSSCAKVCSSWGNMANSIKRSRTCIRIISMGISTRDNGDEIFKKRLLEERSKPNLAIYFGKDEECFQLEYNLNTLLENEAFLEENEARYLISKHGYQASLEKVQKKNKEIRKHLPTDCTLLHPRTMAWCLDFRNEQYSSPIIMVLIPSIPGVEVQSFSIPDENVISEEIRREMEPLYLSGNTSSFTSKIKCIIVFENDRNDNDKLNIDKFGESIKNYISEDTIIVEGWDVSCSISTAIAFSGENIQVECIAFGRNDCCIRAGFSNLSKIGFSKENGIAFVIKACPLVDGAHILKSWHTFFPNITPIGICLNTRFLRNTTKNLFWCDGCRKSLGNSERPIDTIVFLLSANIVCEVVNL